MVNKTINKKTEKCCENSTADKVKGEIHKIGDDLMGMIKKAKVKYDKADPKTKKAVLAGIAGAAALIAGAIATKKARKK